MTFAGLYHHYFGKLTSELHSTYGSGPPDPEDVAQQAFERLNNVNDITNIENPEGFLWVCARNIIISEKRAEQVRFKHEQELKQRYCSYSENSDPERTTIANNHLDVIKATLQSMPPRRRQIFLYNRVHGLTPEKAGEKCGVSRTAAVKHIAAASALISQAMCESKQQQVDG